eukprot:750480-Hanusia_phi.AAC.19
MSHGAIVAETFNAGYVSYPHEIEFDVPLSWIITAAKCQVILSFACLIRWQRQEQIELSILSRAQLSVSKGLPFKWVNGTTCLRLNTIADPKIGPMAEGYNRILLEGKDFNACHPYFRSFSSRKSEYLQREGFSPALCADPDPSVSSMLVELMKEEEIHNGTICYWCMMHPKSPEVAAVPGRYSMTLPQTSNCANRISGAELKQETSAAAAAGSGQGWESIILTLNEANSNSLGRRTRLVLELLSHLVEHRAAPKSRGDVRSTNEGTGCCCCQCEAFQKRARDSHPMSFLAPEREKKHVEGQEVEVEVVEADSQEASSPLPLSLPDLKIRFLGHAVHEPTA